MPKRAKQWSCSHRLWIEHDGKVVLGKGRVELLEAIDQLHSIRQAALSIRMSYRRAWLLVQSINEAADHPLVEMTIGGARGGGTRLTDYGLRAIDMFHRYETTMDQASKQLLKTM